MRFSLCGLLVESVSVNAIKVELNLEERSLKIDLRDATYVGPEAISYIDENGRRTIWS